MKLNELPKTVNIFGQKYKVKVEDLPPHLAGQCDRQSFEILLNSELIEPLVGEVLLHEIGHAVFSRVGLLQCVEHNIEEIIVDTFATAISENFKLVKKK